MPIHIYKCSSCGVILEKLESYRDENLTVCNVCGGELKKQITIPAVHFKGNGFYINDSKPEKKKE